MPSYFVQPLQHLRFRLDEYRVCFYRLRQLHALNSFDPRGKSSCTLVCMLSVFQPRSAFKHSHPRSRQESHLRSKLSRLLASVVEISRQFAIEEQHCLADCHSILGAAKAQHINTAPPGNVGRRTAKTGARIRKSRPVHVQRQTMPFAHRRNRPQLFNRIDAPGFCWLRNGDRPRLWIVNVVTLGRQLVNRAGGQFSINARGRQQFRSIREKLWRAAFVGLNMRLVAANYAVVRLAQRCQRQRVSRGPVEDEVNLAIGFKQLAKRIRCLRGPGIVSVCRGVPAVRRLSCCARLGSDSRIIVACELLLQFALIDFCHALIISSA